MNASACSLRTSSASTFASKNQVSAFLLGILAALHLLAGPAANAQTAHFAWEQKVIASSTSAAQVTPDKYGNLWVAMPGGGIVEEIEAVGGIIPPSPTIRSWSTSLSSPTGVAVDSSGDVFVANSGSGTVIEMAAVAGVVPDSPTVSVLTVFTSPDIPTALSVDSSGDVYVAASDAVYELVAVGGSVPSSPTVVTLPNPANAAPMGVAADSGGNVYVADYFNGTVYEVPLGYVDSSSIVMLGGGFGAPSGVAVDGSGNAFVADTSKTVVEKIPTGCSISACVIPLGSGFSGPSGVGVDLNGNVFLSDAGNTDVQELELPLVSLGGQNIGSASATHTLTFTFDSGGSVGAPAVATMGAAGKDFADTTTGTCNTNGTSHTYGAGDTCTVIVTFAPQHPGKRWGAVLLEDNSGNVLATAHLAGTGIGPQINFQPGMQSSLGGSFGFAAPSGVAVDGGGNLFVADTVNSAVEEVLFASGYSAVNALGGSFAFSAPSGVAVDGSGNLFVADPGNSTVEELTLASGYGTVTVLGGGYAFSGPSGVAVDGAGNLYVADTGNNAIEELPVASGYTTVNPLGGSYSFSGPSGVAVDDAGNIYVADTGNNAVEELTFASGFATVNALGGSFSSPSAVALDGIGDVFVAAGGNTVVGEIPLGCNSASCVISLGSGFSALAGVAVDGGGNVYVADTGNNAIKEIDLTDALSLNFASTGVSATSTDSPQTVTVVNDGNAALTLSGLTVPTDFPLVVGGGDCTSSSSLTSGSSCTLPIDFSPTQLGSPLGESLVLTDNNLNGTAVTETISLSGTAIQGTPGISISNLPASGIYGGSFAAAISYSGDGTASITSSTLSICTVSGTTVNYVGVGTCSLTANATAGTNYTAVTGDAQTFSISQATPTITISNIPGGAIYGGAFTPTIVYNGDGNASVVSNTSSNCTVVSGAVHFNKVGTCSLTATATETANYTGIAGSAQSFSIGKATPTITIGNIPSNAAYNGSFTPSITYSGDGAKSVSSNTTGICAVVSGAVHYTGIGTCSLTASATAGSNYAAITGSTQTFSVSQATPTVAINNIPSSPVFGGSFTPTFTYSGNGSPTLSVATTTGTVCAVSSGVVSFIASGTCSLKASATATADYTSVTGSAQSFSIAKLTPTISINNIPSPAAYGGSFTPTFAYTGNGTVSVVSNTTGTCTVSGGVVNFNVLGTCSLTPSATAGTQSAAVHGSAQTFTIVQATPTISINDIPTSPIYGGSFTPTFTYSGNGSPTFSVASSTLNDCTVSDGVVSYLHVGTCSLKASATSTTDYTSVTGSAQSFSIGQATPSITITNIPSVAVYGGSFTPAVSYTGDGIASVSSSTTGICTVSGGVVSYVGVGTCSLTASALAGTNYTSITGSTQSFSINQSAAAAPVATVFGAVDVGATSSASTVTFTFSASSLIGAPVVVTQGATGLDFADAGSGNCNGNEYGATGHVFSASDTCTVKVTFTPQHPGTRVGAVLLKDSLGNLLATAYLAGTGSGPQTNFLPGAGSALGGSYVFSGPAGATVDSIGNVYVADSGNSVVEEFTYASGYTAANALGGSFTFSGPTGVAVDGSGNIFVADTKNNAVEELTYVSGYATVNTLGGGYGFSGPAGVAVDGVGNVFVADTGNNAVEELSIASGYSSVSSLGGSFSFSGPSGVAVDGVGNVFVADTGNHAVEELTFASGYTTVNTLGVSFTTPSGVAVDGIGNLFVADTANTQVEELSLASGYTTTIPLGNGFSALAGLAVDGSGNIFVADTGNNAVKKIDLADVPSLSFASTGVGATSTDSPQTVTVVNDGNTSLNLSGLTIPADFPLVAGGGDCTSSSSLTSGSSCMLPIDFSPTQLGSPLAESLVLTDNNLNGTAVTQSLSLSGTAVQGTPAISISNLPGSGTYGLGFTATISYSGDGTASIASNSTDVCTVLGNAVSYVGVGTCSLTASATAGTNYIAAPGSAQTISIGQATPSISISNIPSSAIYGLSFTPTFTYTGDGTASVASNSPSICTVSEGVVSYIHVGTCSLTASALAGTNYTSITGSAQSFSIGQATTAISINNLPSGAQYGASFTPAFTYTGDGTPSVSSSTLAICTVSSGLVSYVGVGTCSLTASAVAGTNYAASTGSLQSFSVGQATPAISISNLPGSGIYGLGFTATISYTGDGTASLASNSTSVCTVAGNAVSYVGVGTCSLTASATAGTNYIAAPGSAQSFSIGQATPSITITNIPSVAVYGGSFTPAVSYTGDGIASVSSSTTGICTVSGGVVSYVGVGTCSLTASALAGTNYTSITGSTQSFSIAKAPQVISFSPPASVVYGVSPITLNATSASSGINPITYSLASSTTAGAATLSGVNNSTLTINGVGTVTVKASQAGSVNYTAASNVWQTIVVTPAAQSITFPALASPVTYGASPVVLGATGGSSGNAVTYTLSPASGVASVSGTGADATLTFTGAGTVSISANQEGSTNYSAAAPVTQTVIVNPMAESLTFTSPSSITYTPTATLTLTVSSSGGSPVPVTFNLVSGSSSASLSSGVLTITGAGKVVVSASQAGSGNYAAAKTVYQSIIINQASQTIVFTSPSTGTYRTPLALTTTSGASGNAVIYSVVSGPGTLAGSTLSFTAPGTVVVAADQEGNANYAAASEVTQSISVGKASASISIGNVPSGAVYGGSFTPSLSYNGDGTTSVVSNTAGICTVSGGVVSYVGVGTCSLTASATAGTDYTAVTGSAQSFSIGQANATVSISNLPSNAVYGGSFTPAVTTNSDTGTASVASNSPGICTVSGGVVSYAGAGLCSLTASVTAGANYAAATGSAQSFTIAPATPALAFITIPAQTYRVGGTVAASVSKVSSGAVTYAVSSGPATVNSTTGVVTITGAGTVNLSATQAASNNYTSATATTSFVVNPATPTLAFATVPPQIYGAAPFSVSATSASSGAVTYAVTSGPATVSGTMVTLTGVGTVNLSASQAASGNYASATATTSFAVSAATPTLTFATVAAKVYGAAPFSVSATSVSSGAVTYAVTSGPATVSGSMVTITGVGTVNLSATQAASGNYASATATTSFAVTAATPTLAFTTIPTQTYRVGGTVTASVTKVSNGAVTYSVTGGPATINSTTGVVTLSGAGTVWLLAAQAASGPYSAATATTSFVVDPATPTLTFVTVPAQVYGAAPFSVSATSASSGAVTYAVTSGPATISGSMVTLTGVGTVKLTATQAASSPYTATTATTSFVVNAATPTLTFATVPAQVYGAAPFSVSATSASSGAVTYAVTSGPATISGSMVTLTGVGTVKLTATQAANGNYTSTTATTSFTVAAETPTLTFAAIATQTYGNAAFKVSATSASSGAVTYAVSSGPATVSGSTVTITGVGMVSLTATQAASGNYAAATATVTFRVNKATPAVKLAASATSVKSGASIVFTATLTGIGVKPSGIVTIYDGTTQLGACTLTSSGVCTYATTKLATGTHGIVASYGGDVNYSSASSGAVVVTVTAQ